MSRSPSLRLRLRTRVFGDCPLAMRRSCSTASRGGGPGFGVPKSKGHWGSPPLCAFPPRYPGMTSSSMNSRSNRNDASSPDTMLTLSRVTGSSTFLNMFQAIEKALGARMQKMFDRVQGHNMSRFSTSLPYKRATDRLQYSQPTPSMSKIRIASPNTFWPRRIDNSSIAAKVRTKCTASSLSRISHGTSRTMSGKWQRPKRSKPMIWPFFPQPIRPPRVHHGAKQCS
mmetsp:Transcript_84120/g.242868  ORF Transcript_84120/g.242868 Transcript_84120/m.242868 type:complete len:227 (-) Transcript_84120:633-1313(-)